MTSCPDADDMSSHRIDELTERQKQCLRGIYANLSIKEIAKQLDLSPHTVTEHLRDVRRLLRVSRSMQAARLLVRHEGDIRDVPTSTGRSEEHTSELQSLMRISYAVFCLQKIKTQTIQS